MCDERGNQMKRSGTLGGIILVAVVATALALSAVGAASSPKTVVATVSVATGCQVTGDLTWTGLGSKPKGSVVRILDFTQGDLEVAKNTGPGGSSGEIMVTFAGTVGHTYLADGYLTDVKGNRIGNEGDSSGTLHGGC
jgi:hypothetical protein